MARSGTTRDERQSAIPSTISDCLRRAIVSGELTSGTQLRQGDLAKQFGTSRIPIREALRQLEAEGLVTLHPNRGAVVRSLSLSEVLDLLEIRIALECRALKLAVPNMVEEDFQEAEAILASDEQQGHAKGCQDTTWRFHKILYLPCHMQRLLALIEVNYWQVSRFIRTQVLTPSRREQTLRDRQALLRLSRDGEADKAADMLSQHLARTQKSLSAAVHRNR